MPKKKPSVKAQSGGAPPVAPEAPPAAGTAPFPAAPMRGGIPAPGGKRGSFSPPKSHGMGHGGSPAPTARGAGMNMKATSRSKGARGR